MSSDHSTVLFGAYPEPIRLSTGDKKSLRTFVRTLETRVGRNRRFVCLITGDSSLREMNHTFLGHDYATDVLSFPSGSTGPDLGEIAISAERAQAQAADFGHCLQDELRILMLHGVLHLIGLDHETDGGEMANAEREWRCALGLPAGLIERTASAEVAI